MDELRLSIRRLVKRPAATVASVITLACAIGAAAATWSLMSALLIRPLPVHEPDRLAIVGMGVTAGPGAGTLRSGFTYPFYPHIRDSGVFESVAAAWMPREFLLVNTNGTPVATPVAFVSQNFFDLLGVRVALGRGFSANDDRRGAAPVAVLSERYWRRIFNADAGVLGRTITVADKPVTIIGVAQRRFRGLDLAEAPGMYLPLQTIADVGHSSTNYFAEPSHTSSPTAGVRIIGRLRPDDTDTHVSARLTALPPPPTIRVRSGMRPPPFGVTDVNTAAIPAAARANMAHFARLLGATVVLLLLIGCASVGMLLLVRTDARREEFATCLALGASRARLVRGVALEGAALALAGACLSLPVALWLFTAVRGFQLPGAVDLGLLELSIDGRAIAVAGAGAFVATLLIALIAGVFGFSGNIGDLLRAHAGATPRLAHRRTRVVLVAGQVAVALVLLAGAGLFARSLIAALSLNPNLDSGRILTSSVSLGPHGYTSVRASAFFDELAGRLSRNPALESVAFSVSQGGMSPAGKLVVDGIPRQFPSTVWFTAVDRTYFRTMGTPLIAGRDFSDDDRESSPRVAIVSESFGRLLADGGDPRGHRITMWYSRPGQPPDVMEVVGIVPDVVTNVTITEPLAMYLPLVQHPGGSRRDMALRATRDADETRREAAAAIRSIDAAVTATPMLTIDEGLARQMGPQRFGMVILGALGTLAILLTIVGTYVLAESMAMLRMREMGIRAALGATGRQLGGIVLAETARLVCVGISVGLILAWMGASTLRALLYRVQPLDAVTLSLVSVLILALALAVSLRPALRAARVDLASILRAE